MNELHMSPSGYLCIGPFVDRGETSCCYVATSTEAPPPVGAPIHHVLVCQTCGTKHVGGWTGRCIEEPHFKEPVCT